MSTFEVERVGSDSTIRLKQYRLAHLQSLGAFPTSNVVLIFARALQNRQPSRELSDPAVYAEKSEDIDRISSLEVISMYLPGDFEGQHCLDYPG